MDSVRRCNIVEIVTPKKILLNGIWFGPSIAKATKGKPGKPKRAYVWVHGLGSSMFSKLGIMEKLVARDAAVLAFNNRGHDGIARISRTDRTKKSLRGGSAHEVFTDCVDDIQGAINFAKKQGAKEIILVGHSTGCQKSVYWASKRGKGVRGIVLLAPISDYAAEVHLRGKAAIVRATSLARALVGRGKKHSLLPDGVWHETLDAQRFLSLYSGTGPEEIFPYWSPMVSPRTLRSIKLPTLVLIAESDEYADRPAQEIAEWFARHKKKGDQVSIVAGVEHGFRGAEQIAADRIRNFS